MSNVFDNGTVLPSGLLGQQGIESAVSAFNRTYRNTGIKAGIVIKSYAPDDPFNQNGLCMEYDVVTIEQFENKGSTSILYRNCVSTQGFGSLADYLEYTLRPKTFQTNKGAVTFGDQDGAIAIIQCLDNVGDKAIVTGNLIHPDRPTNITGTDPQLFGEYNGVNVTVNTDGSYAVTFKGATDSKGVPIDSSQGNTIVQTETDGSFQINNSEITLRLDKTAKEITMTSTGDWTVNIKGDTNITTSGDTNLNTTGTTTIISKEVVLNKKMTGITTAQSHQNVIDLITGVVVIPSETVFGDV